jgi:aminopeptidase N
VAKRRLKNTCLDFLSSVGSNNSIKRAKQQYDNANCMTDRLAALGCLVSQPSDDREEAIAHFHAFAGNDPLMLNKWFAIQAMADLPDLLSKVKELKTHPNFLINNPNALNLTNRTSYLLRYIQYVNLSSLHSTRS